MTYTMAKHVAVVVKSADSDAVPYYTVNMVDSSERYPDSIEFPTLEQAQAAAEAQAHSNGDGHAYGWVHNSDLDTWAGFKLVPHIDRKEEESFDRKPHGQRY